MSQLRFRADSLLSGIFGNHFAAKGVKILHVVLGNLDNTKNLLYAGQVYLENKKVWLKRQRNYVMNVSVGIGETVLTTGLVLTTTPID